MPHGLATSAQRTKPQSTSCCLAAEASHRSNRPGLFFGRAGVTLKLSNTLGTRDGNNFGTDTHRLIRSPTYALSRPFGSSSAPETWLIDCRCVSGVPEGHCEDDSDGLSRCIWFI